VNQGGDSQIANGTLAVSDVALSLVGNPNLSFTVNSTW
jgi:hypothetical protein